MINSWWHGGTTDSYLLIIARFHFSELDDFFDLLIIYWSNYFHWQYRSQFNMNEPITSRRHIPNEMYFFLSTQGHTIRTVFQYVRLTQTWQVPIDISCARGHYSLKQLIHHDAYWEFKSNNASSSLQIRGSCETDEFRMQFQDTVTCIVMP